MPLKLCGPPSTQPDRDKAMPTRAPRPLPNPPPQRPKIIGLFSLSGAGTTFLVNQLKKEIGEDEFAFYDANQALEGVCPGGLLAYNPLDFDQGQQYRDVTINAFQEECAKKDVMGVVVRYLTLWDEDNQCVSLAPSADVKAHTHILYLELPFAQYSHNSEHSLEKSSQDEVEQAKLKDWDCWQKRDISYLRRFCHRYDITFTVLTPHLGTVPKVSSLIKDLQVFSQAHNRRAAKEQLMRIMETPRAEFVETVLLFDADGTLSPQDSEYLLWCQVPCQLMPVGLENIPSKATLSHISSSYKDYLQTVLLHEEVFDDQTFADVCQEVAAAIKMYPDMLALLRQAIETPHTLPIIVTGGPRLVWEIVLKRVGLFETVHVIGSGRHKDHAMMTPEVKGLLVALLQGKWNADVWAFGSNLVDAVMFLKADKSVFVTDSETWLIDDTGPVWKEHLQETCPQLQDVLLSTNSTMAPQYQPQKMHLLGKSLVNKIFSRRLRIFYITRDKPSTILMSFEPECSPTYPIWRSAHHEIGALLANRFLKDNLVDENPLSDDNYMFPRNLTILAATPGSMPMALGIHNEYFGANFLTPDTLTDLGNDGSDILTATRVLVLVKSVIINESFLMDLLKKYSVAIESLVKVVIVAGVIRSSLMTNTKLARLFGQRPNVNFVTLHFTDDSGSPDDAPELENV
ncbi:uncharacterized protein N7496_007039 [Penicillium cataractarum]|uniref:Uncharacterized protein n=1 Tax=Penicillium cataractarum TaxID=2100454 RepID=A0A9W9V6V8_9EURO|nr:uncharacterized protein N7496_007039 [Penicillium cataractarum]KAJ5370947.1 hypothetical protein N7496_007039 [Penicillium cataractarum]